MTKRNFPEIKIILFTAVNCVKGHLAGSKSESVSGDQQILKNGPGAVSINSTKFG
jgi:hypothetical protein